MSLKSDIKMQVASELGVRLDEQYEAVNKELAALDGRRSALLEAAKKVEGLLAAVDKQIDDGSLLPSEVTALTVGAVVKRYITRIVESLSGGAQATDSAVLVSKGKLQGLEQALRVTKQLFDKEKAKADALLSEEVVATNGGGNPSAVVRPIGMRPEDPLADRRRPKEG
jgi:hypothetical protein